MPVSRIVEAIQEDENAILPVSHVLSDKYGDWSGISISLPCVLNSDGIRMTSPITFGISEKEAMDASVKTLKDFLQKVITEE